MDLRTGYRPYSILELSYYDLYTQTPPPRGLIDALEQMRPQGRVQLHHLDSLPKPLRRQFWAWEKGLRDRPLGEIRVDLSTGKGEQLQRALSAALALPGTSTHRDDTRVRALEQAVFDAKAFVQALLHRVPAKSGAARALGPAVREAWALYLAAYEQNWKDYTRPVDLPKLERSAEGLLEGLRQAIAQIPPPRRTYQR
jgi:hypothetical protein